MYLGYSCKTNGIRPTALVLSVAVAGSLPDLACVVNILLSSSCRSHSISCLLALCIDIGGAPIVSVAISLALDVAMPNGRNGGTYCLRYI